MLEKPTYPINRCRLCFELQSKSGVCSSCQDEYKRFDSPIVLQTGTILNGNYQLGKVLGKLGGFGITYLAWDMTLEMKVAIKEYLPRELAGRDQNHVTVIPHSEFDGEDYQKGLEKFLQEARTLASIDHPNIVRVRAFFRENNSAYLVMDYYEGTTLEEYVKAKGGRLSEGQVVSIMIPVLDGIKEVHSKGILHRDIKPENIYLTKSGRVILLDFGAARQVLQERSRSMTIVLTPGFSPFEQTFGKGMQGPWTDVYGCAATMYYLITGVTPQRAEERLANDRLVPIRQLVPDCSYEAETVLIRGMSLHPEDRFQSAGEFQESLIRDKSSLVKTSKRNKRIESMQKLVIPTLIATILLVLVTGYRFVWPRIVLLFGPEKVAINEVRKGKSTRVNAINPLIESEAARWRAARALARMAKKASPFLLSKAPEGEILGAFSDVLKTDENTKKAFFEGLYRDSPGFWGSPEIARKRVAELLNPIFSESEIRSLDAKGISAKLRRSRFAVGLEEFDMAEESPSGRFADEYDTVLDKWKDEYLKKQLPDTSLTAAERFANTLIQRTPRLSGANPSSVVWEFEDILKDTNIHKPLVLRRLSEEGYYKGWDPKKIEIDLRINLGLFPPLFSGGARLIVEAYGHEGVK